MSKNKTNPVILISGEGYNCNEFGPILDRIQEHLTEVFTNLQPVNSQGAKTAIKLNVDAVNGARSIAYAKALNIKEGHYYIELGAGLSYQIWLASRAFETEYDFFRWLPQIKIKNKALRSLGRRRLLADFAYHVCSYAVILHEVSHILLGHNDYLASKRANSTLDEFSGAAEMSLDDIEIMRAFEADADRQAAELLMIFLEGSAGADGLGIDIRFPSRAAFYEFTVYAITSLMVVIQQALGGGETSTHPKPNTRQFIYYSSMSLYLEKTNPELFSAFEKRFPQWGVNAGIKMGILNADNPVALVTEAQKLSEVGEILKKAGVHAFKHKFIC